MQLSIYSAFLIALCSSLVLASPTQNKQPPPPCPEHSDKRCYTRVASTPCGHEAHTTWGTYHPAPCTTTEPSTKKTTITPSKTTSTIFSTTTITRTGATSISTATVISHVTSTIQSLSTITDTETDFSTTTATSTVPAPAGFTPVQDSLPEASYVGSGGGSPVQRRDLQDADVKKRSPGGGVLPPLKNKKSYPQAVTCYTWEPEKCSTKTKVVTSTIRASAPKTTIISTVTRSTTTFPSATTTVTSTLSTSISITVLTTTTSTTTVPETVTTTTVYAACATENFADRVNGQALAGFTGPFDEYDTDTTDSAYDCCVAALTDPNGAAQGFVFALRDGSCTIPYAGADGTTCPNPQSHNTLTAGTTDEASNSDVIGNGLCGEFTNVEGF